MIVMTAGEEDGQDDHREDETPRFAKRCRIAGCPANGNRHEHEQQPDGCRKVVALAAWRLASRSMRSFNEAVKSETAGESFAFTSVSVARHMALLVFADV